MTTLNLPVLELAILIPLLGGLWICWESRPARAQNIAILVMIVTLLITSGACLEFYRTQATLMETSPGAEFSGLVIDELSAPLLPLVSLLYLLTALATLRTKIRRFSFSGNLVSLSILLATLSFREPIVVALLLVAGALPPFLELRARHKPTRVYLVHMAAMAGCLLSGLVLLQGSGPQSWMQSAGTGLITVALLIRIGIFPFHCWLTDLFEHATFGSALLVATPMIGAYAYLRMVLPLAPQWQLDCLGYLALFTALYGSGMALVQSEVRRFFCFLLISHSAIVLLGLQIATPQSVAGALCVWLSVALALSGFGLTLRSIEAREGRLSLASYHGLYPHMPTLATFFLLTGLASVGFPGTFGFIGAEMLLDGMVQASPGVGIAVIAATTLAGIAVVKVYFLIFTGKIHVTSISLVRRTPERIAILALAAVILGGGLVPQPSVASRHHAAQEILEEREASLGQWLAKTTESDPKAALLGNEPSIDNRSSRRSE